MQTTLKELPLLLAGVVILSGCISHNETIVRDVERTKIEFESDAAARIFYEALSKAPAARSRAESKTEVSIPIVFDHKQKVVSGPNAAFNDAVAFCDTNKDGKITELEARIYAQQRQK